jgi:hypothetical protein
MSTPRPDCAVVHDDLNEFALGILNGRHRSRVLDHVTSCEECRSELEALAVVADDLMALAPHVEPPLGFESRLVDRYHAESRKRSRRAIRIVTLVAAAFALVAVGYTLANIGSTPVHLASPTYGEVPISASLTSQGRSLGHVWVSSGSPSWIYMSLDDANWSGTAWCRVTLKGGRVMDLGAFTVTRGYGAWAARVDSSGLAVRSAQVTDVTGHILASATLST